MRIFTTFTTIVIAAFAQNHVTATPITFNTKTTITSMDTSDLQEIIFPPTPLGLITFIPTSLYPALRFYYNSTEEICNN